MSQSPKFLGLFIESIRQDYSAGGAKRLFPYLFLFSIGAGSIVAFNIPESFYDSMMKFIPALITAQGIILAMSMQTSGTILSNISQGEFSAYLKSHGILGYYMLLVQFIQYIHLMSLFFLLSSVVVLIFNDDLLPVVFKIVFALGLGMFIYALRWTWGTTVIVRDLIYWRSEFQYDLELKKAGLLDKEHH